MGRHDADEEPAAWFPHAKVYAGVAICVIAYLLGLTMGGFWTSNAQSPPPAAPATVTITVPAPPPSTTSETPTSTRKRSSE